MDDAPRWLLLLLLLLLAGWYRCGMLAHRMRADTHRPPLADGQGNELLPPATVLQMSYLATLLLVFWYAGPLVRPLLSTLPIILAFPLLLFATGIVFALTTLLPQHLVGNQADRLLQRTEGILTVMSLPFLPLALVATAITSGMTALLRLKDHHPSEQLTQEQLRDLVDVSEESGLIEEQERTMIHNIFDFDQIEVGSLMTHRTDMIAVSSDDTVQDLVRLALEHGFSRLPVYEGDLDNIKGFLFVKDFLCFVGAKGAPARPLTDFIRPALFVPQAQKCTDLLGLLKEHKTHIAIVVDDFGGTAGLISMEDLLEAIVGNIQDEYDHEPEPITKLSPNVFQIDGATSLEQLEELFSCTFDADPDTTTISGLITSELGRIPQSDETPRVTIKGIPFDVVAVGENRITTLKVDLTLRKSLPDFDPPSSAERI